MLVTQNYFANTFSGDKLWPVALLAWIFIFIIAIPPPGNSNLEELSAGHTNIRTRGAIVDFSAATYVKVRFVVAKR